MALGKCRECGAEISTEAKTCPKCGVSKPVKPAKRSSRGALIVFGVFLVVLYIAMSPVREMKKQEAEQEAARVKQEAARVASLTPEQRGAEAKAKAEREKAEAARKAAEENEKAKAKAKRDTQLQMAGAGALTLKTAMKDPEAFELRSLVVKPNGTACYEYRAKNSFGASFPGSAVLTSKGKLLTHERDGNSFVAVWNKECTPAGGDEIADLVKRLGIL